MRFEHNQKEFFVKALPRSFFERDTVIVARELLGMLMMRMVNGTLLVGRIVETEAYKSVGDAACHAARGVTPRTRALFGPVGHAYIYKIYGIHYNVNVVARSADQEAGGVLIRAVEPLVGHDFMQQTRAQNNHKDLTNGPGKLTQAFSINKELYGTDLLDTASTLWLAQHDDLTLPADALSASPRIGISQAQELLWRFFVRDNPHVTRSKFNNI